MEGEEAEGEEALERLNAQLREESGAELLALDDEPRPAHCPPAARYLVVSFPEAEPLGEIPIAKAEPTAELLARARQLLRTPREELKSLVAAKNALDQDRRALLASFGVDFRIPNAGRSSRLKDGALETLFPFSEYCTSADEPPQMAWLQHETQVRLFEFVPGRVRYSADSIYARGELLTAFVEHPEAFRAQANRLLENNIPWCPRPDVFWMDRIRFRLTNMGNSRSI